MNVFTKSQIEYFFHMAEFVATKSTCLSRQVGAVLVKDNVVVATGYNGPPRGYSHCSICPRRQKEDYAPSKYLEICPAVHAEVNCIASAARVGVCVKGTTLFINTLAPCKSCMATIINAGVQEVFALDDYYDDLSRMMNSLIRVSLHKAEEIFP